MSGNWWWRSRFKNGGAWDACERGLFGQVIPQHMDVEEVDWKGPGEKPHVYSPDYMAMGDCRVCGHVREAHG